MRGFALVLLLGLVACGDDNDLCPLTPGGCEPFDAPPGIDGDGFLGHRPAHPAGQQGCLTGQKVAWIRIQEVPEPLGKIGCVPDGTMLDGQACAFGPTGETTGHDNCAGGLICSESVCRDICYTLAEPGSIQACATGACALDPLLFHVGNDDNFWGACRQ
jgi:hypothetical protein